MLLVYNILLRIYQLLISLVAPFNKKASLWIEGRRNYFNVLQSTMYKNTAPIIWFHSASLGEFEQSRPLIEEIKKQYPQYNILLTFFSPSGYEIRKNYELADYVMYLPLDTAYNARKFIRVTNPKMAFFAKYEFWYHYVSELHKKNIPIISFSAIFRKDQIFFKPYGGLYRKLLKKYSKIFVQNNESISLLKSINISQSEIAGDTRFDRVAAICKNAKKFPTIEIFKGSKHLLVVGSSWEKDINVLIDLINAPGNDIKVIIAPHEIDQSTITSIEKKLTKKYIRYSNLNEESAPLYNVLIIDNIGMLSALYQYADYAYVGGAFGKGLHNILEPATFGLPIFFGPKYEKFQEAKDLVNLGSAFSIKNTQELMVKFNEVYSNERTREKIIKNTKNYVAQNTGATKKILDYCHKNLA